MNAPPHILASLKRKRIFELDEGDDEEEGEYIETRRASATAAHQRAGQPEPESKSPGASDPADDSAEAEDVEPATAHSDDPTDEGAPADAAEAAQGPVPASPGPSDVGALVYAAAGGRLPSRRSGLRGPAVQQAFAQHRAQADASEAAAAAPLLQRREAEAATKRDRTAPSRALLERYNSRNDVSPRSNSKKKGDRYSIASALPDGSILVADSLTAGREHDSSLSKAELAEAVALSAAHPLSVLLQAVSLKRAATRAQAQLPRLLPPSIARPQSRYSQGLEDRAIESQAALTTDIREREAASDRGPLADLPPSARGAVERLIKAVLTENTPGDGQEPEPVAARLARREREEAFSAQFSRDADQAIEDHAEWEQDQDNPDRPPEPLAEEDNFENLLAAREEARLVTRIRRGWDAQHTVELIAGTADSPPARHRCSQAATAAAVKDWVDSHPNSALRLARSRHISAVRTANAAARDRSAAASR